MDYIATIDDDFFRIVTQSPIGGARRPRISRTPQPGRVKVSQCMAIGL